jgi:hypothetical protein
MVDMSRGDEEPGAAGARGGVRPGAQAELQDGHRPPAQVCRTTEPNRCREVEGRGEREEGGGQRGGDGERERWEGKREIERGKYVE